MFACVSVGLAQHSLCTIVDHMYCILSSLMPMSLRLLRVCVCK